MQLLGVSKLQNKYILPPWLMYLLVSALYWILFKGFCFIRICCCFTVRNHDVLLDYMGTTQWGPHVGAGVFLWILRNFSEHLFYKTPPVAASDNLNHKDKLADIQIGDIMIIKGESENRRHWKLAIVEKVRSEKDYVLRVFGSRAAKANDRYSYCT